MKGNRHKSFAGDGFGSSARLYERQRHYVKSIPCGLTTPAPCHTLYAHYMKVWPQAVLAYTNEEIDEEELARVKTIIDKAGALLGKEPVQ